MNFRLDISAKTLDSLLSTGDHLDPIKVEQFMRSYQCVTEKIDGLKITAWRNDKPFGRFSDNWVIAYKNYVLYENEFVDRRLDLEFYQFQHVMVAMRLVHTNVGQQIPPNTELFLEFAADKSTLMQKYTSKGIFLIGCAESAGEVVGGYLQTTPRTIMNNTRWLTRMPGWPSVIETPPVLFQGHPQATPRISIMDERSHYHSHEYIQLYENWKQQILDMPSCIGPRIEGGVGTLGDTYYKIQQSEQNNKVARQALRTEHQGTPEQEQVYWESINKLLDTLDLNLSGSIEDQLWELKTRIYQFDKTSSSSDRIEHPKKTLNQIYNDVYVTGRLRILRAQKENQNALIVGRFQPLTAVHADIIRKAATKHHIVWVAVVVGRHSSRARDLNPLDYYERKELIEALGLPNVRVIQVPTGSVRNIISSIPSGITALYCGTDRVQQYQLAVQNMNVEVVEVPRIKPISGTQLRAALRADDKQVFESLVDPKLYSYYEKLKDWMI